MDLVTIIYSILFYRMEKEWNFGWLSSSPKRSQLKKNYNRKKISNLSEDQGVLSIKQQRIFRK